MKYWIQVAQLSGIALFAGAAIASPTSHAGIFWGIWLILLGYVVSLITEVKI